MRDDELKCGRKDGDGMRGTSRDEEAEEQRRRESTSPLDRRRKEHGHWLTAG